MKTSSERRFLRFIIYCHNMEHHSRGCSVNIVTRLRTGRTGFDSRRGQRILIFLFSTASRPALDPTHLPIRWVRGLFSREWASGACSWPLISI